MDGDVLGEHEVLEVPPDHLLRLKTQHAGYVRVHERRPLIPV